MFRLAELQVKDFRSIKEQVFVFQSMSILIGKNNAGKTNIVDAIAILLEGTNRDVSAEDFFGVSKSFTIKGRFCEANSVLGLLESSQKTKVANCVDSQGSLTIRRTCDKDSATLSKIEVCDSSSGEFSTPTGIDAALRRILPEVIRLRPLSDVSDEVSGRTTSALTKLLGQITSIVETQAQPLLDKAYAEANTLLNVQKTDGDEQDERVTALKDIETAITAHLQEAFPSTRTRINVELPSVKQILGNVQVLVHDGSLWKPYYRHGHGLQRALCLSLLRTLALYLRSLQNEPIKKSFMLLLEEPETFLHPSAQEQMREALQTISKSNQVIFSTHSPFLVTMQCLPCVLRVSKAKDEKTGLEETVAIGPLNVGTDETAKDVLAILNFHRSSKIFFADALVLVEGEGDIHLHRAAFEKLMGKTLEQAGLVFVEIGGKDRLARMKSLLKQICRRVVAVADIDYIWDGAGNELGSNPILSALCSELANLEITKTTEWDGLSEDVRKRNIKKLKKDSCSQGPLLPRRDSICDELEKHGTFVLREGEVEDYVGLSHSSKGKYLEAANEVTLGKRSLAHQDALRAFYTRLMESLAQMTASTTRGARRFPVWP